MTRPHVQHYLDVWATWLATDAPRRVAPTTIQAYLQQLRGFANWLEETLDVAFEPAAVTAYRVEQYLLLQEAAVKRKQRKASTYNKTVAALSSFGAWLVNTGYVAESPARRLRALREQPGPPKALDRTVVAKLLDAAHHTGDLRDALIVELLAHSGMRASEVAAIQLEDLEVGHRTTWIQVLGKGEKQRRVPLPKQVGALIQQYLDARAAKEGIRPRLGALLVGERGGITRSLINRTVALVAERARLTPAERALVTPHSFRHTVATALVRKRDLITAADLLGHSSLSTTRRYSKASAADLEAAVQDLYTPADPHAQAGGSA